MRWCFLRFTMKHYYRAEMVTLQCNYPDRIAKNRNCGLLTSNAARGGASRLWNVELSRALSKNLV